MAHLKAAVEDALEYMGDPVQDYVIGKTFPLRMRFREMMWAAEIRENPELLMRSDRHRALFCRLHHELRTSRDPVQVRRLRLVLRVKWKGSGSEGGRPRKDRPNEVIVLRSVARVHDYVSGIRALVNDSKRMGVAELLRVFPEADQLASPLPASRRATMRGRKPFEVTLDDIADKGYNVPIDGLAVHFVCKCLNISRSKLYVFVPGLAAAALRS
jgi:hypothetical protein